MKKLRTHILSFFVLTVSLCCILLVLTSFKNMQINKNTPTKHLVTIYQMKFDPENIKIKKGDIVEWVNKDFVPHDVTEIDKKWTSKPLNKGAKFSKVITKDIEYFCSIHVVMKGSVTVTNK